MDLKKISGSGEGGEEKKKVAPGAKPNQAKQLLLLLILIGGFGYVYFFTDLIRPLPTAVKPPVPPSQSVRKALPPRETALPAAVAENAAENGKVADENKTAAASPGKNDAAETRMPPATISNKKAAPEQPPAKNDSRSASSPLVTPKNNVKMAAVEKATEKKAVPKTVAPEKEPHPAADVRKKSAYAVSKEPVKAPSKKSAQPVSTAKGKATAQKPPEKGMWKVVAGGYLLESEMSSDIAKIKKAGFNPSVVSGGRIRTKMNRLFAGEFEKRDSALAQLDKLKKITSDAFLLEHGGKISIYAGSYLLADRAEEELERIARGGFKVTLRKTDVNLPSKVLSVGSFTGRDRALEVRAKLAAAGVSRLSVVNQ